MWQLFVVVTAALLAGPLAAAEVNDATGRTVAVPDRIERVMAAGPPATVVLYVLAPEKMIGWTAPPRPNEKPFLLPAVRDLPELGRLTGRGDTANVEVVINAKPDIILDFGTVNPTFVSLAQRVQEQTRVPYLLFDGRLQNTARSIRQVGAVLGVSQRADYRDGRGKPSRDQVETPRSFASVTLGYVQPLDSTLFFRGISFCQNGAGRRQQVIGIKSYKPRGHGALIIEMAATSRP